MKRRSFLVGAALWPSLIRRAFADASFDVPGARQLAKKTQLVIIVPADDGARYDRGELWGEFLNHASPAQLAPLATVDVTCATKAALGESARGIAGEPLAIVIERNGKARALDTKVPAHDREFRRWDAKNDDAISDARIAAVSRMIASLLPPVAGVDVAALGRQAIRTLREVPPSGAHWARASGCGPPVVEDVKDDDRVGYGCGMGHVPAKASRFLYFFATSSRKR